MLLYRLIFEPGAERVTFHTVKNFQIGAHIAGVINSNFPYFHKDGFLVVIYDKNGKPVHNKDVIGDGCTYFVKRRRGMKRSSCPKSIRRFVNNNKCKKYKKYWRR